METSIFITMKQVTYLIVLIFTFFLSCKKEVFEETTLEPNTATKQEITFGDETEMHLIKYDYILETKAFNPPANYNLDVDSDGTDDLKFTVYMTKLPMMGSHYENGIRSLNSSIQLSGYLAADTNFVLTTVKVSTSVPVQVDTARLISCKRSTPAETILDITPDQFKLRYSDKGIVLKKDGVYQTDSVPILHTNVAFTEIVSTTPDTMIIRRMTFTNDCDAPAYGQVKYIGFKINTAKGVKMGWVKLMLLYRDKIHILESAIQK